MAAMLQQQHVVQETEPKDWAACGLARNPPPPLLKCPAPHISYEIWHPWLYLWAIWFLAMKHAKI